LKLLEFGLANVHTQLDSSVQYVIVANSSEVSKVPKGKWKTISWDTFMQTVSEMEGNGMSVQRYVIMCGVSELLVCSVLFCSSGSIL
jgi:hypothetical protein